MPVSTLHEANKLTNQQLADFALQEDRAARAALKRGETGSAVGHILERDALARMLK